MKTIRLILAALTLAIVSACSADITGPESPSEIRQGVMGSPGRTT
jgi:hypothetical protein